MVTALLQRLVNDALRRGGGSAPLARFSNRVVAITLLPLKLTLLLRCDEQGIALSRGEPNGAACHLQLDQRAWPLLKDPQQLGPLLNQGAITLSGDAELAADLLRTLRQQGVNGEELLAGLVGDPLAHLLGCGLAHLGRELPRQAQQQVTDIGQWLRDEQQLLVAAGEWQQHSAAVTALDGAVRRAEQRLQRLMERR